jgi:hypothetical protein
VLSSLPFKIFVILLTALCLAVTVRATLRGRPAGQLPGALTHQWNNRKYGVSKIGFLHAKGFLRVNPHFGHASSKRFDSPLIG